MITGSFTKVEVPQVAAGQQLKATLGYYALNPGAWWWKTFLIAIAPGRLRQEVEATRELGEEGHQEHTYWLGDIEHGRLLQPDKEIGITFFLFGHDDAGYQWDWQDLDAALMGTSSPSGAQLLATYPVFTGPGEGPAPIPGEPEEPPEGARLSGAITRVAPTEFAYAEPVDLSIDFKAYVETIWEQTRGWDTRLTATLNGLSDSDLQYHIGREGQRTSETLNLGAMPNKSVSGTIVLEGRGKNLFLLPTEWKELDRKRLTINLAPAELPPVSPPPEPTPEPIPATCQIDADCPKGYKCKDGKCVKKDEWLVPALIVGAALLLLAPGKKKGD